MNWDNSMVLNQFKEKEKQTSNLDEKIKHNFYQMLFT